jgi:phosphatidylinositol alpha 1,6-mannosyltransferase
LTSSLRVALFTDSYTETNGVATVSRHLAEFARDQRLPFVSVFGGQQTAETVDGSLRTMELKRGFAAFRADHDLYCDPLLSRHRDRVLDLLRDFRPDLVHITGPGDVSVLGLWVAHTLRIPLVASWHTNLHEYLARRLEKTLARLPRWIPRQLWRRAAAQAEALSLNALMRFYRLPRFLLAPSQPMADLLEQRTGRSCFLMGHGVDLKHYTPAPRCDRGEPFRIGYVGRLTPEKNVRALAALERSLVAAGAENFRFLLVGEGGERAWLKQHLQFGDLPGTLYGAALADAFRSMDAFVFPSETDTFGLVVLEAMASGVPAVVNGIAAAALGLADGNGGLIAEDFTAGLLRLMREPALHAEMSAAARRFASSYGWSSVFEELYRTYEQGLAAEDVRRAQAEAPGGYFALDSEA